MPDNFVVIPKKRAKDSERNDFTFREKSAIISKQQAPVAQWIEHQIPVLRVGGSSPFWRTTKKGSFVYQTKDPFFELSVSCGTISTPSVREVMLRIVKRLRAWVAHLTSHCAKHNTSQRHRRCFTWRSQTSPKVAYSKTFVINTFTQKVNICVYTDPLDRLNLI